MAGTQTEISGIAGRYANALFELALDEKAIDRVQKDLSSFGDMLGSSSDMQRLVTSPVFTAEEQGGAIDAILAKAGIKGIAANFLGLVARNRRLFAVDDMIKAYRALVADHRGEVTAEVTTAAKLTPAQTKSLQSELDKAIGKKVQIDQQVDPTLLGGMIVKVGSRMIDSSIRTKLDNMKLAMKEAG